MITNTNYHNVVPIMQDYYAKVSVETYHRIYALSDNTQNSEH